MMPSSRSMLSFDKRLPPDTWNTSGLQDNVFGNQFSTFDSPRDHHQGIHPRRLHRQSQGAEHALQTLEKAKAKAKAKLDDAKLAADQEWEALKHASSTPAHKVSGMTPEERETGAAGAVSVLSLASAVGDRKTALVGGVAANVLASSNLPSQASARDRPHATSAAAGSSSSADSSSLPDVSNGTRWASFLTAARARSSSSEPLRRLRRSAWCESTSQASAIFKLTVPLGCDRRRGLCVRGQGTSDDGTDGRRWRSARGGAHGAALSTRCHFVKFCNGQQQMKRVACDREGHHRAACTELGRRAFAVESAGARICREAGGRVAVNVMVRDMDIAAPDPRDGRRLEIVVDGLPLFGGAQFAVDTTLVSALHCDGSATAGARDNDGAALVRARRRKERTYPGSVGRVGG